MNIDTQGFELDDVVRDRITGYEGTVVGITQWTTGCARAVIQARIKKDGTIPDSQSADVLVLEMVKKGPRHAEPVAAPAKGGPMPTPSRGPVARR